MPTRSAPETPAEATGIKDAPGVVSAYTRGSIVPDIAPEHILPHFRQSAENAPERVKIVPFETPRPPAPRLEMGGGLGQVARNSVRQAQRMENRVALDKLYGANAVRRMMAQPMSRRAVELGDDFRQAMPKLKHKR